MHGVGCPGVDQRLTIRFKIAVYEVGIFPWRNVVGQGKEILCKSQNIFFEFW